MLFTPEGGLVNTESAVFQALNRLLLSMQRRSLEQTEIPPLLGLSPLSLVAAAIAATGPPPTAEALPDLERRYLKLYRGGLIEFATLMPRAAALLEGLKHSGISLALLSPLPTIMIQQLATHLKIESVFTTIVGIPMRGAVNTITSNPTDLPINLPIDLPILPALQRLEVACDAAALISIVPTDLRAAQMFGLRPIRFILPHDLKQKKSDKIPNLWNQHKNNQPIGETFSNPAELPNLLAQPKPAGSWLGRLQNWRAARFLTKKKRV